MPTDKLSDWLEQYSDTNCDFDLSRLEPIAKRLALLEWDVPIATIAGTNGKGTCITCMEQILVTAGYNVGCYSSPHLFSFTERIRVNAEPISESLLEETIFKLRESLLPGEKLTFFEHATFVAWLIFKQYKLDILLLEVGLGGAKDVVNLLSPQVAIITSISLDHCNYLGNTIEEIGSEKAGIMRDNIPVFSTQSSPPSSVITKARELSVNLHLLDRDYEITTTATSWDLVSDVITLRNLPVKPYHLANIACAIMASAILLPVPSEQIRKALFNFNIPGRFEVHDFGNAQFIFDVAHNPAAANALAAKLEKMQKIPTVAIIGIREDKDIPGTMLPLANIVKDWYSITPIQQPIASVSLISGQDLPRLFQQFKNHFVRVIIYGSFKTVGLGLTVLRQCLK